MRYAKVYINLVLAFDVAALIYYLVLVLYPFKTVVVHQPDRVLNLNKTVVAGSPLEYQIDYCKYTHNQAQVTRALIGPVTYSLPASTNNIPVGCGTAISRNTIIPVGIQPGVYHLELTATYEVNFLRRITVPSRSENFTVVALPVTVKITQLIDGQPTAEGVLPAVGSSSTSP